MADEQDLPFGIRSRVLIQKQSAAKEGARGPTKPLSEPTQVPAAEPAGIRKPGNVPQDATASPSERLEAAKDLQQGAIRLHKQRKLQDAELLYRRSCEIVETIPGNNSEELARATNNLGRVLHDQKKYDEAERLYKRSVQILETILPPGHRKIAKRLQNLAALYRAQGRDAEADLFYKLLDRDFRDS